MGEHLDVSKDIAAPAERVWAMVSDVTRMGEWSPENQGAVWLKGATGPVVGARFKGRNEHGTHKWETVSTVLTADPGKALAFRVVFGPFKIADWAYTFAPAEGGCRVTETWTDRRNPAMRFLSKFAGPKVPDRAEHNRQGMVVTLDRLAAAAEATA